MMTQIFTPLEKAGLIKGNKVRVNKVLGLPFTKTLELLDTITAIASRPPNGFRPSTHTHCATFDLGGNGDECSCLECRLSTVNELARFAALYSDHVYVHNFLANHAPTWGHPPDKDSLEFRQDLIDDFTVFLQMRPLIENGRIIPFSPPATICPYCYAKTIFGSQADKRLQRAMKKLSQDLAKETPIEFCLDEFGYAAYFSTAKNLFRHQTHMFPFETLPKFIASHARLAKRIEKGEKVLLKPKLARALGIYKELTSGVLIGLRYQMSVADIVGSSFLTHRDIDLKILSYVSGDEEFDRRNAIAQKCLTSIVPFAGDIHISKLAQLRQREEEAFIQFRAALDKTLEGLLSQRETFTERDAQALYADILAPEIARLDQKVLSAKRDLIRAPFISAIGTAAMIGFGLYSGMITPELKIAASTLGLANVLYDTITKTASMIDVHKDIRPEKFYFLWRVRHYGSKTKNDYYTG